MYEWLAEQVMVEILEIVAFYPDPGRAAKEMSKLIASLNVTCTRISRMSCYTCSVRAWTGVLYVWTINLLRDKTLKRIIAKTNYETVKRYRQYVDALEKTGAEGGA